MRRAAFVTLVATDGYCPGALVLAHSLRHHRTAHALVCLVTEDVSDARRSALAATFDEVVRVARLDSNDAANLQVLGRPELGVTWTKIAAWSLRSYDRACFLDADTFPLRNVDELLEEGGPYEPFAAAPDSGWPDCFNSGVFVFRPSQEDFEGLTRLAAQQGSFDGGDQGLFNAYFSDWPRSGPKHLLPFTYNTTPSAAYSYAPAFHAFRESVAIFHFIGLQKPWDWTRLYDGEIVCNGDQYVTELVSRWWNIHDTYVSHWTKENGPFSKKVTLGLPGELPRFSSPPGPPVPYSNITSPPGLGDYRVDWNDDDTDVEPVTLASLTVGDAEPAST